ncbi:MAG: HAMP domain-containing histidine kinase [Cytophagales bacterium]|nr:HAMP domain-containing histidine kinase [Cytophagales bacterium]
MKGISTFRNTLVIISVTILLILGTQVYRTINNYQINKRQFVNDVQLSLDLSVEKYYADKARSHFAVMTLSDGDSLASHVSAISLSMDSLEIDSDVIVTEDIQTRIHTNGNGFQYSWSSDGDEDVTVKKEIRKFGTDSGSGSFIKITTTDLDSLEDFDFAFANFSKLTQKIMISSSEERMDTKQLGALLEEEFERRNLSIGYRFDYSSGHSEQKEEVTVQLTSFPLNTKSKSTYLLPGESLNLYFDNATLQILRRGATDLIVSFLIVFSVIGALLYLYRIIKNQKELAMIKDDLIGNVTHEFKTPIATVSTALEGIANFNEANDPEKTKRYINMSRDQLVKLNLMVEKLMETATIDSGDMEISKVDTDLSEVARKVVDNFQLRVGEKTLQAELPEVACLAEVDPFHLENVLTNLIDNAIKYGGNDIRLTLKFTAGKVSFQVIDNGGAIDKAYQQRIFEKLYRIPKGNQHDVKGFGIGLYYTKAIIERHEGQINLDVSPGRTCFTVTL